MDTAGTASDGWASAAAPAAVEGGRVDASSAKRSGDRLMPEGGAVAGSDRDAAAAGDLATAEAAGGSASAAGDWATVEPAGASATAARAGDSTTSALCGSSLGREREAGVSANGDGASASAAAKAAGGDLECVFAANSGCASGERGSCLIWPFLCPICLWRRHRWASWGCSRTRGCGSKWS